MTIKVNDRNWAVGTVDGAQQRKSNCVVTAKGNNSRQCFAIQCRTFLSGIRFWLSREDTEVTFFDLMESICIVVRRDRDITTVQHGCPAVERVGLQWYIVTSAGKQNISMSSKDKVSNQGSNLLEIETAGSLADARRSKPGTGTIRCASVKGSTLWSLSFYALPGR